MHFSHHRSITPCQSSLSSIHTNSLAAWTMALWHRLQIADDVTQELCGSPDYGRLPQSMLGRGSHHGKAAQAVTTTPLRSSETNMQACAKQHIHSISHHQMLIMMGSKMCTGRLFKCSTFARLLRCVLLLFWVVSSLSVSSSEATLS